MSVNRFPNLWEVAPGLAQIEQNVIRWLCDLFGYPHEARGILTTGGSIANLSAVVTARHVKLGEDFEAAGMTVAPPSIVFSTKGKRSSMRSRSKRRF